MTRPTTFDWTIQEGEETEEMPVGSFLPNAFREAQEKYINFIEEKVCMAMDTEGTDNIHRVLQAIQL